MMYHNVYLVFIRRWPEKDVWVFHKGRVIWKLINLNKKTEGNSKEYHLDERGR